MVTEKDFAYSAAAKCGVKMEKSEVDLEIEALREKLNKARLALAQTQKQMELHRIRTRQVVTAWKIRIYDAEERLRLHREERDAELKDITAQLLFFEGQLRREQLEIRAMLNDKDRIIEDQRKKIARLRKVNDDLQRELEKVRSDLPRDEDEGQTSADGRPDDACAEGKSKDKDQVENEVRSCSRGAGERPKRIRGLSSSFHRTFSLPSCMNTVELITESSRHVTDVDEAREIGANERVLGRRDLALKSRSNRGAIAPRDLSRSEQNLSATSGIDRSRGDDVDGDEISRGDSSSSRDDCISEKKGETSRDRIKRAFMRPRDVKKRSKMRFRSTSLKADDPKDLTPSSKRFFSFTF